MRDYTLLEEHLQGRSEARIPFRFADIEEIIGSELPASAREHRAWWSNNPSNNPMTYAWLNAGYHTEDVNMASEKLTFVRVR